MINKSKAGRPPLAQNKQRHIKVSFYLNDEEYEVLRLSYGLDCDKLAAKEIADKLNIKGVSDYVRVSELKKQAVQTLIDNVDHSQVLDYL